MVKNDSDEHEPSKFVTTKSSKKTQINCKYSLETTLREVPPTASTSNSNSAPTTSKNMSTLHAVQNSRTMSAKTTILQP